MSDTPSLVVNGETRLYPDAFPHTVAALLDALGLDRTMVVAEVNGDIVGRDSFPSHALNPGDRVELVRFVGGG